MPVRAFCCIRPGGSRLVPSLSGFAPHSSLWNRDLIDTFATQFRGVIHMNRLVLALVLGATAVLAGCEEPAPYDDTEMAPPPLETEAPAAADSAEPAAAPAVTDAPPADTSALPPDQRSSEQTVQPESETLFY